MFPVSFYFRDVFRRDQEGLIVLIVETYSQAIFNYLSALPTIVLSINQRTFLKRPKSTESTK